MSKAPNRLAMFLRGARRDRGLSVRELARMVGRTPGYLSRVEGRGEIPSTELICELGAALRIDPAHLFDCVRQDVLDRTEKQLQDQHCEALALYRRSQ
ncbi:MAG: helix-turn-helix transcriptional regulator [Planctomycetota bacterium]